MSAQLGLVFSAAYLGRQAWGAQVELIRAAVRHLTAKEVASECDVGHTILQDALYERDRKVWHPHWTLIVKAMLASRIGDDVAADLLLKITEAELSVTPYAPTENVELTPEEENAAYKRELLKFGDAGKQAVERVKKRGRR